MEKAKQKKSKKEYTKPVLQVIKLTPDEVLGTGCKTSGGFGMEQATCAVTPCSLVSFS